MESFSPKRKRTVLFSEYLVINKKMDILEGADRSGDFQIAVVLSLLKAFG